MILEVAKATSKNYRDATLTAAVFETINSMSDGETLTIEKVVGVFGGEVAFDKFRTVLSKICKVQNFRVTTKITRDNFLLVHRIK